VITKTLESAPRKASRWSMRSIAAEAGLSPSAGSCRCFRASPSAPPTTTAAPARPACIPPWTSAQANHRLAALPSVRALNTDIRGWIKTWNNNPRPYVWTKTAEQILGSIATYCNRIKLTRRDTGCAASVLKWWGRQVESDRGLCRVARSCAEF
jgi:hypothetical protein